MESEISFVHEYQEPKTPAQRLADEMRQDLDAFDETDRDLMERYWRGESLQKEEESRLDQARDAWWRDKYGFPFSLKTEREEVLRRKYAPPAEMQEAVDLQNQIVQALKNGDKAQIETFKGEYVAKYPDQLEGVTALFEFLPHLKKQAWLNETAEKRHHWGETMKEAVRELTEYQFLLTHFISLNGENKEFLNDFWSVLEKLAADQKKTSLLNKLRHGVLSQVAVYRAAKSLGRDTRLSHPKEDAFNATDIWIDRDTAIQVKGHKTKSPVMAATDEAVRGSWESTEDVSFPGVELPTANGAVQLNSHLMQEYNKFRVKLDKYAELTGRNLRGYLVQVPYHEFDFVTGEPSEKFIKFVGDHLGAVDAGISDDQEAATA